MDTENIFKDRLNAGDLLYGGWAGMGSTVATEILGYAGFDWVLIDGEHGNNDLSSFVTQLLALNTGPAATRYYGVDGGRIRSWIKRGKEGFEFI